MAAPNLSSKARLAEAMQALMTRRAVLLAGAAAVAAVAVGAPLALRTREDLVRRLLVKHFGRDVVSGDAADRFIADAAASFGDNGSLRRRIALIGVARAPEGPLFTRVRREIESTVVTLFLRRTNAYRCFVGADDALVYSSLDPYATGCGNFLSAAFKPTAT